MAQFFPSQDSLQEVIFASLAALPLLYCLQEGVGFVLSDQIEKFENFSSLYSEGKNINCENENIQSDLTIEKLRNTLVCIEGVIRPLIDGDTLTSINNTDCVYIQETEYQNKKLSNIEVRTKPWCLGGWEKKNTFQKKCFVIDQDAFHRLVEVSDRPPPVLQSKMENFEILRPGGKRTTKRQWWDIFSSDHVTTQAILPTLTRSAFVGKLVLNSDGNFLLTSHHTLGFQVGYIPFQILSTYCHEQSMFFKNVLFVWKGSCRFLGWMAGCVFVGATVLYFARKYHLFPFHPPRGNNQPNRVEEDNEERSETSSDEEEEAKDDFPRIQSTLCVICLDLQRNVLIKPCMHFCLCANCARSIQQCPVCRIQIDSQEVVYNV
jgi:hypothetical protein